MTDIEDKFNKLPKKEQKDFQEQLKETLHDRNWFNHHKMDYVNPNLREVQENLYKEMFNN